MATQRYVPAAVVVKEPEVAVPALSGLGGGKTRARVQVVLPGAKSSKVTLAVGLKPPATVAVSEIAVPTGPPAEGAVEIVGVARVVGTGSAWQPELTLTLLASPS